MNRRLVLLMIGCVTAFAATSMRRVARVRSGPYIGSCGRVVCCDSDHDSLPDLIFSTGTIHPTDPQRIEVWEHQGWNRFSLVSADTGTLPGTTIASPIPFAVDDVDDDGLTDVVCITIDDRDSGLFYNIVMTLESPDSFSYPCSLSWYYRCGNNDAYPFLTCYLPDMDGDGHKEIFSATPGMGTCIWENTGDDQNQLVWRDTTHAFSCLTFGDFDMDGRMDLASASAGSAGLTSVWECTGDDQYEMAYQDTVWKPNGADAFTTNDIDGDGKPEFYVAYQNIPRRMLYLYMWEMIGDNQYSRTLVDSLWFGGENHGRISECGDIDADGVDECIWTTPTEIYVYKAVGDNNLQRVWNWYSDHGLLKSLVSTVYDINNDGYNELITAGNGKISIFEIDAVDLLSPNGGTYLPGDTLPVRWVTHTPPRCDSLSLFLRRDSLWSLDTIAHGLPATDSQYQWVIPASVPDTGRIVVIVYGEAFGVRQQGSRFSGKAGATLPQSKDSRVPWQFDISDSVIHFTGGGVAEGARNIPKQWSLSVSPNPARGAFTVRYDVPGVVSPRRSGGASSEARFLTSFGMTADGAVNCPRVSLGICDAGGRLVRSLSEGDVPPGRYEVRLPSGILPAGVYFCTLGNGAKRISRKLVLTE